MKKLIVKNRQNEVLQTAKFESDEAMNDFIEVLKQGAWGKPEHQVELSPRQVINHEEVPAVIENDVEVYPAILAYDEVIEATFETVPSEYLLEIVDVTAEVEQQRINSESLSYLYATDFMLLRELDGGVAMSAEVKLARAEARARIVR